MYYPGDAPCSSWGGPGLCKYPRIVGAILRMCGGVWGYVHSFLESLHLVIFFFSSSFSWRFILLLTFTASWLIHGIGFCNYQGLCAAFFPFLFRGHTDLRIHFYFSVLLCMVYFWIQLLRYEECLMLELLTEKILVCAKLASKVNERKLFTEKF